MPSGKFRDVAVKMFLQELVLDVALHVECTAFRTAREASSVGSIYISFLLLMQLRWCLPGALYVIIVLLLILHVWHFRI